MHVFRTVRSWWAIPLCVLAAACGSGATEAVDSVPHAALTREAAAAEVNGEGPARSSDDDGRPVVVALGDSLTAGLGISPEEAYPARVQEMLDAAGYRLRVLNAGVSGDTSAGALRRLDWALDGHGAKVVALLVALGGNDGLRGLPVDQLKANLTAIITAAQDRDVEVLLAGMEAPPNFGHAYTDAFRRVYRELADEHDLVFVPFLLEGVAGVAELNQRDGIHPNADGAARVAAHVWPAMETVAGRVTSR